MDSKANLKSDSIAPSKPHPLGLRMVMDLFDVSPTVAIATLAGSLVLIILAITYFIHSAPPSQITISTGPEGSSFQKNALKYAKILERDGVTLNVLTSKGSLENLQRLTDPSSHVDLGIVQGGITIPHLENLMSLASISYQPLLIFYRGKPIDLLSELKGKRVAIGSEGSGTHSFAIKLLEANGIKEGESTPLLNMDADDAYKAMLAKKIDAAFVMSESASSDILHNLLRSKEIHLFSFKQANGYSRKIDYLNVMDLPEGSIDFGTDIPSRDVTLLGPMVELVATKNLHPALVDLLLEAAMEVHSRPGLFQKRGEFPAPIEHAIPISKDSKRFFKSGKSFLYQTLPFWLASLISRILLVFVPMLVILVPGLKSIPAFFRWRVQRKIHLRYRELLAIERELEKNAKNYESLRDDFERIETQVYRMRVPASFADQYYGLRGHIDFVRNMVTKV